MKKDLQFFLLTVACTAFSQFATARPKVLKMPAGVGASDDQRLPSPMLLGSKIRTFAPYSDE